MSQIPPLSTLPEPTRLGEAPEGGWTSRIWTRGGRTLRIRSRGSSAVLDEFEGGTSTRRFEGSLDFAVSLANSWFRNVGWEGETPCS